MAAADRDALEMAGLRFQVGICEEALRADPEDTEALRFLAHAYTRMGRLDDGLTADRRLAALCPADPRVRYNLACSCSLTGRAEEALAVLQEAIGLGFDDLALLRKDTDLDPLRADPRFRALEVELEKKKGA